jgi:hypothetical protein
MVRIFTQKDECVKRHPDGKKSHPPSRHNVRQGRRQTSLGCNPDNQEILMSQFVLLYRSSDESFREHMGTPEKAQQSMMKWRAWIKDMTEKGQLKNAGQPLERSGKVVGGRSRTVTDGPYAETKDLVGGFSIIEAPDIAEAARIASGCPILEGGGSVEVRPVRQFEL